jgi:hypothetical protein
VNDMGTSDATQVSELRDRIAQFARCDGDHQTSIPSLCLIRHSASVTPEFILLSPALCIAAQGQKEFPWERTGIPLVPVTTSLLPLTFRSPHASWKRRKSNRSSA